MYLDAGRDNNSQQEQQVQDLCVTSTKNIAKYEEERTSSQVAFSKSLNLTETAIEDTAAKLEVSFWFQYRLMVCLQRLRSEINDIQTNVSQRSAEMAAVQEKIAELESRRTEYTTLSKCTELDLQTERAAKYGWHYLQYSNLRSEERISKYVQSKATIQIFGRKMRLIIFNEKKLVLKDLEILLKEEVWLNLC